MEHQRKKSLHQLIEVFGTNLATRIIFDVSLAHTSILIHLYRCLHNLHTLLQEAPVELYNILLLAMCVNFLLLSSSVRVRQIYKL